MADNNNAALSDALGTKMDPIARYEKSTREAGLAEQKLSEDTARIKQEAISPLIKQEQEFRDVSAKKSADVGAQLQQQFKIPEATMGDFAQLGGLIAVMGPMLGAAGKQSANVALGAMTGILDGYQKGRKDVIEQSYKQFDTNMKRLQALQKQIDSELTAYTEKMKLGREDALLHAESAVALARGGVAEKLIAGKSAGDILRAQQTLQQMGQSAQQHRERIDMEKKRYEAQATKEKLTPAYTGQDGKVYNKMGEEIPVPANVTKFGATAKGTGAGDRFGFGNIVATNINEAVGSIGNIVNLPFKVSTGTFQGRNTTGLLNAPLGALTNNLTKEDVQRYNAEISNFGKFASRVVSGGRVVPASVQKDFEEQYKIREGDKPLTVLTKLAMMRQTLERAAEVYMADPNTSAQTKEIYQRGLEDIRTSIPFTVNEINKFAKQRDNKTTFAEMFPDYGFGDQSTQVLNFATEAEAEKAAREGKLKSGQKVRIGNQTGTWE